jgi:hypothetical protein
MLNLIALKLYSLSIYRDNIYSLLFILLCIISSIILRSNIFFIPSFATITSGISNILNSISNINHFGTKYTEGMVSNYYNIFILTLVIASGSTQYAVRSTIYSFKLIFDIIIRCIQAYKIIPEFIRLYKQNMINIKSIISLYYLQHVFFIALSLWILYIILSKFNLVIDGIYRLRLLLL